MRRSGLHLLFHRIVVASAATLAAVAFAAAPMAEGEVRKVDAKAKTITLKHGPIPGVDMGAMTMTFPVKDAALLAKVKAGEKVKFAAEKVGGDIVVTAIEPAK
jgi:Cu/Ag efflux protein CusF